MAESIEDYVDQWRKDLEPQEDPASFEERLIEAYRKDGWVSLNGELRDGVYYGVWVSQNLSDYFMLTADHVQRGNLFSVEIDDPTNISDILVHPTSYAASKGVDTTAAYSDAINSAGSVESDEEEP